MMSDLKIIFAIDPSGENYQELWSLPARNACLELGIKPELPESKFFNSIEYWKDFIGDADGIITTWGSPALTGELLQSAVKLRIIGHAAGSVAGYINPRQVMERNITVVSANEAMAHSVAEWCMMASLMGIRNVGNYMSLGNTNNYKWDYDRKRCGTLHGKRIGIWGYGAIAACYREMLRPFQPLEVLVCSNHLSQQDAAAQGMRKVSLERLFQESDVIQLLAGLNNKTCGLIDRNLLSSIRDGAVLVNGGRAALVNEDALLAELEKQRFVGVFDVFHEEPLPVNSKIASFDNVMVSPHNAGYPSRGEYVGLIANEFARFFCGKKLKHEVKYEKVINMTTNVA